jgi:plastocyanin
MKFSITLMALFLPVFVNAQSSSSPTATAPTPSASIINVAVVPGTAFVYIPADITAANGTIVNFVFYKTVLHSVTQSTFDHPCTYLAASNSSSAGFDSGLHPGKEFNLTVTNDQEPVYFFCKEAQHCGLGMVGTINAPSTGNTGAAFLAAAKAIGTNEPTLTTDSGPVTGGVGAVATSTPTSTSSSSPSSSKSSDARRLVARGVFALLAPALGIALA